MSNPIRINPIRKFFLVCSGATVDILSRPECKTEVTRYAMIGAFVALTATFAALSGGYALYTGFKTLILAVPVGILWGAFIFTLDRFIVSSLRKRRVDNQLTLVEKALIKLQEFAAALPRLILATFIAMTVAIPLEMKYFESEIDARLSKTNLDAAPELARKVLEGFPEIETRVKELQDITDREKELGDRRDLLRDQLFKEADGAKEEGYSGIPGEGPRFAKRREEYKRVEDELAETLKVNAPRKQEIQKRLDELRAEADKAGKNAKGTMEQGNGFLARFRALNELSADESVRNLTLFLVILLTLIETAPVIIKLFAGRGPYEDLLETIEHKIYVNQQKEISNFNSDVNTDLEIYKTKCQARRQYEERALRTDGRPIQDNSDAERIEPDFQDQKKYAGRPRADDHWEIEMETAATD